VIFARVSSLLVSAVLLICGFPCCIRCFIGFMQEWLGNFEVAEIFFAGNSISLKLH
jgi:hypothetical protein